MIDYYMKLKQYFPAYGLKKQNPNDRDVFCTSIKIALEQYHMPLEDICDEFGRSKSTVRRWAAGESAPPEKLRLKVLEWILDNI